MTWWTRSDSENEFGRHARSLPRPVHPSGHPPFVAVPGRIAFFTRVTGSSPSAATSGGTSSFDRSVCRSFGQGRPTPRAVWSSREPEPGFAVTPCVPARDRHRPDVGFPDLVGSRKAAQAGPHEARGFPEDQSVSDFLHASSLRPREVLQPNRPNSPANPGVVSPGGCSLASPGGTDRTLRSLILPQNRLRRRLPS